MNSGAERLRAGVRAGCEFSEFEAIDPLAFAELVNDVTHFSHEFGMLSVTFDDRESFSSECGEATRAAVVDVAQRALKATGWRKIEAKLVRQCRHALLTARSARLRVGGVRALQVVANDIVSDSGCSAEDFRQALALVCQSDRGSIRLASRQEASGAWQSDVFVGTELVRLADLRCASRALSERAALLLALQQQVALRANTVVPRK